MMALTKLEVKQQFVWKRDRLRQMIEVFLDRATEGKSAAERAELASQLYTLFDMHTEIANASMLEVLQAAAEVGFAMSSPVLQDMQAQAAAKGEKPDGQA